ncbi:MAG: potassium/proton antiporter [Bacteroidales bacterium]|nr:potassium/proton antiporter [Bacteroidales bacterium]MBR5781881.1 potassium/proton antiporter [Bacteroidales bacterium]
MFFTPENMLLIGAVIWFASILLSKTGYRFGVPVLLVFLLIGMMLGGDGLGISFDNYKYAQIIGMVALTIILFSGGMDTKFDEIKPILGAGVVLSTLGVLLTTLFTGFFIWGVSHAFSHVMQVPLTLALLLAATMSSTDSASVFNVLRSQKMGLRNNLQPMLEFESGSNDPMAYMLTIVMIQVIQGGSEDLSMWHIIMNFVVQFGFGLAFGYGLGRLCVWIINKINLPNKSLYPILMLSFIFFIFSFTNLFKGNGYLAVYVAGIVMGNSKLTENKSISSFLDGVTWLVQIVMFLVLGLLVNPHEMFKIAVPALIIAIFVIFVGRPLSVFLCLIPFKGIGRKAKTFISWVGLRGAAPIIFATYPVVAEVQGSSLMFNVVFFITLTSLLLQGTTIPRVANWLNLSEEKDDGPENFGVDIPDELNTIMQQEVVQKDAYLKDYPLNEGTLVMIVERNQKYMVPNGKLLLKKGDKLLLISAKNDETVESKKTHSMLEMISEKRSKQR